MRHNLQCCQLLPDHTTYCQWAGGLSLPPHPCLNQRQQVQCTLSMPGLTAGDKNQKGKGSPVKTLLPNNQQCRVARLDPQGVHLNQKRLQVHTYVSTAIALWPIKTNTFCESSAALRLFKHVLSSIFVSSLSMLPPNFVHEPCSSYPIE